MLIDFLIVGTQKGGTSALAKFLAQHPNIFIPKQKELHFFDIEANFKNPQIDYNPYHGYFHPNKNQTILGEATPIYMYWEPASKRIFEYNQNIKQIFILRNPVERAYSNYIMEFRRKGEYLPFTMALLAEPVRRLFSAPLQNRSYSYIDRGFYSKSIKRIMTIFPREQLLFLKTEDLLLNHESTLNRIFEFLEVPGLDYIEPEIVFSNNYPPINKFDKQILLKIFNKEIVSLENLLSWDLSDWKK